jgi:hypothetical protein
LHLNAQKLGLAPSCLSHSSVGFLRVCAMSCIRVSLRVKWAEWLVRCFVSWFVNSEVQARLGRHLPGGTRERKKLVLSPLRSLPRESIHAFYPVLRLPLNRTRTCVGLDSVVWTVQFSEGHYAVALFPIYDDGYFVSLVTKVLVRCDLLCKRPCPGYW